MDSYKVKRLKEMLDYSERSGYGAKLVVFGENVAPITIDSDGLKALIKHYEKEGEDG